MSQNREIVLPTTDVKPEKALSNIRESEKENMPPDSYAEFEPEIKASPREPAATVSAPVADAMNTSEQHAHIMKEDMSTWSTIEKGFKYTKLVFEGKSLQDELATLSYRRATGEKLSEEEDFKLLQLNSDAQELEQAKAEYDYSFAQSFLPEVAGASFDVFDTFRDNYEMMLAITAGGATVGGGIGLLAGPPGAVIGAGIGAVKGAAVSVPAAFIRHTYVQTTGQIYNDLSFNSDEDLPEQTKVNISKGAGLLSAGITLALPILKFTKNTPFAKKLLNPKKYVREALKTPATRSIIMKLAASSAAAEGAEEAIQEVIQVVAVNLGDSWDGEETSFLKALEDSANMGTVERAAKAAALGAVAGQAMQTGLDVATSIPNRLIGEPGQIVEAQETDLTNAGQLPTETKGVKAIQLKAALDMHLRATQDSNTRVMLPEKMAEIRQQHFEDAGTAHVFVDKEELSAWANDDERAAKALTLIGPEGIAASEINAPIRIETHKFLKIAEEHPEITNLVKSDPTGPSAMNYLMKLKESKIRREKILAEPPKTSEIIEEKIESIDLDYVYKPINIEDNTEGKVFYHGTQGDIVKLSDADVFQFSNVRNLYGEGLYLTDNPNVAKSYATKGDREGKVLSAKLNDLKLYDLEKPLPDDVHAVLSEYINEYEGESISKKAKGSFIYEELKTAMEDSQLTESEVLEIYGELNARLSELGYDGLRHEGGQRVQAPKLGNHNVVVLFEDVFSDESGRRLKDKLVDINEQQPLLNQEGLTEPEVKAREELVKGIAKQPNSDSVKNLALLYQEKIDADTQKQIIESPERVDVVESFMENDRVIGEMTSEQQKLASKNQPIYSIDPNLLSERLKTKYEDDPVLKARKVFRKDGLSPEQVSQIYNQDNVEQFLETMAKSPRRQEMIDAELKLMDDNVEADLRSDVELENNSMSKAYDKITKLHLADSKIEPLVLQKRARDTVGETSVASLNVDQWAVGARRSQAKATAFKNDSKLDDFIKSKESAALATQLAKETRLANSKVNRAFEFFARMTDSRYQAELNEAGKIYVEAVKHFTDTFNLNPNDKGQSDIKQYEKYLKKMADRGEVDHALNIEEEAWLVPQDNPHHLTVDQVLFIENKLKAILHTARMSNVIYGDEQTVEMIADAIREEVLANPAYKKSRLNDPIGVVPVGYSVAKTLSTAESLITNNQYLVQELDQGKLNGLFAKILHQPITGVGEFEGPTGLVAKAKLLGEYSNNFKKIIKKHYGSESKFNRLGITVVTVPELSHIKGFGNEKGKFTRDQLIMMLANMGNMENRAYIKNFGIEPEALMDILRTHLPNEDFAFAQEGLIGSFKSLGPRLAAVHKSTTGEDLDFVKAEPFTGPDGTVYPGGYFPIMIEERLSLMEEIKTLTEKAKNFFSPAMEGIVRSPHTKERIGSQNSITLDMNRFSKALDDVIHDITMREPVRDVMTLLNDPSIKDSIITVIGKTKYKTLVDNVANLTHSASGNNIQLHKQLQGALGSMFHKVEGAFAVNYIAFNLNSALMSSLVLPQVALKMGPGNFAKYGSQVALKIGGASATLNGSLFKETYRLAAEIDPSLQLMRQGIEDYVESALAKQIPKRRLLNWRPYAAVKNAQEAAIEFGFTRILGGLDTVMKMYTTVAVYNMYIAGDAPGSNYFDVHNGKTEEEIHRDAKAYTAQFLEGTTMRAGQYDKSALQNNLLGGRLTKFWNEARNVINNALAEGRNVKRDSDKMVSAAKSGDFMDANLAFQDAGGRVMSMFAIMMASQALVNIARDRDPFVTPEDEEEGTVGGFLGYHLSNPGELASNYIGSHVPMLRDMLYAADTADRDATPRFSVSVPFISAMTDFATARNLPGVIYEEIQDGMTLTGALSELKHKEQRALFNSVGYLTGGIPGLNQGMKMLRWMEDEDIELPNLNFINQSFLKNADEYISDRQPGEDAEFQKLLELSEKGVTSLDDAMIEDLKLLRNQMKPLPEGEVLTDYGYGMIKHAESNGRWNATPAGSGAYGIYQFTEGTWRGVMATPEGREAGLTRNGRYQKNPTQQEKAMRILTKYNTLQLRKDDLPINIETIYFAHHFGANKAKLVYAKADKIKLSKTLLTPAVLKANPQLREQGVKTVGDMKKYIKRALKRGEKSLTNSQP